MFHLAWIWMLAVLPLPLLVMRWLPRAANRAAAVRVPFFNEVRDLETPVRRPRAWRTNLAVAVLAWVLLVLAASRPQWVGEAEAVAVTGRDLLLAVDISESMRMEDLELDGRPADRLQIVKQIANEFIARREGDRIGLVLFGSRPYLQVPLSFDRDTVQELLAEAEIGIAGKQTAIGDAIGLAVKHFRSGESTERVLVLLTDGANTAGELTPLKAAEIGARAGLTIYTIGVGAEVLAVRDFFGTRQINPSSDLDETVLRGIADATGGRYFRARDSAALSAVYRDLDRLEPAAEDTQSLRPTAELFFWPLALALGIVGVLAAGLAAPRRMAGNESSVHFDTAG